MECSVIIIDDHPLFSRGLAQLIETQKDFKVVGMAKDRIEALDLINKMDNLSKGEENLVGAIAQRLQKVKGLINLSLEV